MKQFYVYIHKKPDGTPVYVGKGHGKRAYKLHGRNPHHQAILDKYTGQIVVEITNCESEQAAFDLEKIYVKQLRNQGYRLANMTDGGEGVSGYSHNAQTRKKIGIASIGRIFPEERNKKISQARRGQKLTDQHRKNLSEAKKGKHPWNYGKTGQKQSVETRQKRSKKLFGQLMQHNASGLPGVSWLNTRNKWQARAQMNGTKKLKLFENLLDAAAYVFYLRRTLN